MDFHRQVHLQIAQRIEEREDLFNDVGLMITLANTYLHVGDFQHSTN